MDRARILTGPLRSTIFFLALPVLGEQALNLCVAFFDVWLAGHLPDSSDNSVIFATGAVGLAAYVSWLATMVAALVGAGTTALVSRFWGSGRRKAASRVTNRSLAMAGIAGVLYGGAIYLGAGVLTATLGFAGPAATVTADYLRAESLTYPPMLLSLIAAAAMRGSGDMLAPLRVLVVVNVTNVVSSWLLALGPGPFPALGSMGIVAGTILSRYVQAALLLMWLASGKSGLRLRWRQMWAHGSITRRIVRIGAPAALDGLVFWAAHFIFLWIVNQSGPVAFAAHIIGIRVESLTYLTAMGWGVAASTTVGQSLGAGDAARARAAGHEAAKQASAFGLFLTVFFVFASGTIFAFMTTDPAVRDVAVEPFRVVGIAQIPMMLSIVYVAAVRGAGETRLPMIATAAASYLIRLPLSYGFAVTLGWGLWGAWLGMSIDMLARGAFMAAVYVWSRWEKTKV